jgi:hypothetical protein
MGGLATVEEHWLARQIDAALTRFRGLASVDLHNPLHRLHRFCRLDEGHWQKSSHFWHKLADALAPKCLEGLSDLGLSDEQTESFLSKQRAPRL